MTSFRSIPLCLLVAAAAPIVSIAHSDHDHEHKQESTITSAADWITRGDDLMQQARDTVSHDFTAAAAAYTKALKLEPENSDAMLGMALVGNSNHDFATGKQWAEKTLAIDPRNQGAHALLGDGAIELGDYDGAYNYVQSALDISTDLSSLSRAAHLLWITGKPDQGINLMRQAIAAGGTEGEHIAWCRAQLALMLYHKGELDSALPEAEVATKLAPKNPLVVGILGRVQMAKGDNVAAIASCLQSIKSRPTHDAMATLCRLYQLQGDTAAHGEMVKKIVAYHLPDSHHHHGHAHGSHDHDHSHHGHSHEEVGSSQLAKFLADEDQQLELALKQAELAYKNFPNVYAADALSWCHYRKGDFKTAQKLSILARAYNTPDASLLFHAGMIEFAMNNAEKSREHLVAALELNPNFDPLDAATAETTLAELTD